MRSSVCVLGMLVLVTAGCGATPTAELLTLTFDVSAAPFEIDTRCDNGGCEDGAELTARVAYDDEGGLVPPDASVDLLQYRVDYDAEGIKDAVQFLAGAVQVRVPAGQEATVELAIAGTRQRAFLLAELGPERSEGTATLRLEGYDSNDELVQVSGDLAVAFGDFVTLGGAP